MEARLVVDPASIVFRRRGPATGDISLTMADTVFPAMGWNDYALVILDAWLGAVLRTVRRTSNTERVHFMEGPYAVDMTRVDTTSVRIHAVERPNHSRAVGTVTASALVQSQGQRIKNLAISGI
jgi:hypothetical protein